MKEKRKNTQLDNETKSLNKVFWFLYNFFDFKEERKNK